MNEKPIIFSTNSIKAIIAGNETQTRRLNELKKVNENPGINAFVFSRDNLYYFKNKITPKLIKVKCPWKKNQIL